MPKTTTWWRDLASLLAAFVLALLLVSPTIASAACVCDERPSSAVARQTVEADRKHDNAPCEAACCLGGHCHHAGALLGTPPVAVAIPAPGPAEHMMTAARAMVSRTPSPLDQPPRA
jgi:hypothetical protein